MFRNVTRLAAVLGALTCALALPTGALAAKRTAHTTPKLHHATGAVYATGWGSVTIQTSGRMMGVINAMTRTATAVAKHDYTYVWGGGHAIAGVASVGITGPGYTGHTAGYDCSGSVAAVLAGAGLWPAGSSVPNDAGVIHQLLSEHIIARGAGTPPREVTLYDKPGVHIFMNIDGRFFGTSDGAGGGNRRGGAGWLSDGAPDAHTRAFKRYHVLPSVLRDRTSYGHDLTFQTGAQAALAAELALGDRVRVGYTTSGAGTMTLQTVSWVGAVTATGTVTAITSGGGFSVQTAAGKPLTLSTGTAPALAAGLQVGDQVQVTYTRKAGVLTARTVTVTAPPVAPPATPAPPATAAPTGTGDGSTDGTGDPSAGDPWAGDPSAGDPSAGGWNGGGWG